jgi:hypothetical protein
MPRTRISKMGAIGLNTDTHASELPPNAWTDIYNCRTLDGKLTSIKGEHKLFDLDIKPLYHTSFVAPDGIQYLIVSDAEKVYAYKIDGTALEITPAAGDLTDGAITFTDLNGVLVVNSISDGPFYWDYNATAPDNILVELPGWDTSWRCVDLVAYKYYLVAMNMTEGLDEYQNKVRWSNSAEPGSLPTIWGAAITNDAGSDVIGDGGVIVGGTVVRDYLAIVFQDSVYAMHWIGGDYIMQIDRLEGANVGTNLRKGFVEMPGGLALFTTYDINIFDGQQLQSLSYDRVNNRIFSAFGSGLWYLSEIFYHPDTFTMIVAGVEAGLQQQSIAFTYNVRDNTWGHRKLNYAYGFDSAFVNVATSTITWDDLTGTTWDDMTVTPWDYGVYQPSIKDIVVYESSPDNTSWWVSLIGLVNTDQDGTPKTCTAERTSIAISGADTMAMITDVWPEVRGDIPVTFQFGGQDTEDSIPSWGLPLVFTPGVDYHLDPRITGRFLAMRISSNADGEWAFGSLTINWESAGER